MLGPFNTPPTQLNGWATRLIETVAVCLCILSEDSRSHLRQPKSKEFSRSKRRTGSD